MKLPSCVCVQVCVFLLLNTVCGQKAELSKSDMIKLDFKVLAANQLKVKAKDPSVMPAYHQLIKDANVLLNYHPVSVMDKTDVPPSGNKHDYMSIAPYWWPDPSQPNGIPYIRRDGEVNPEVKSFPDKTNFPKLCENVYMLSLAYYFSADEKYAKHAIKLIQVWFLDANTSMNPNLQYGQAIKGVIEGRAEGIIEARHLIFVIDAIQLLKGSKNVEPASVLQLKEWFKAFSTWLRESTIGKDEMAAKNNHGVWYDATALAIAIFIDNQPLTAEILQRAAYRLDTQMDDQGLFPLELARTTSLHYAAFVLDAFIIIGQLSENASLPFWQLETASKKSLSLGCKALLPYLANSKKWNWQQIKPFNSSNAFQILLVSSRKLKDPTALDIIKTNANNFETLLLNLL